MTQYNEPFLTADKILALAASLRGPKKPPIYLVSDNVKGAWRGTWKGQVYVIIDRSIEDQLRRNLAFEDGGLHWSLARYQGVEFREDDLLVAALFTDMLDDYFMSGDGSGAPVGFLSVGDDAKN